MTNTQKLIEIIPKLSATEFIGLARLLRVGLYKDEKDENDHFIARPFSEVFEDVLASFNKLERKKKREILTLLKKATTKPRWRAGLEDDPAPDHIVEQIEGEKNASDSEDT